MNSRLRRIARLEARAAVRSSPQPIIIIPPKPKTPEERAAWLKRFAAHQLGLVAFHRRQRLAMAAEAPIEAASPFPVGIKPVAPFAAIPLRWMEN